MKKLFYFLFIFFYACMTPDHPTLNDQKKFFIDDFLERDSGLIRQAQESGLLEKLKNAPTFDSFAYYKHQFQQYNDSIVTFTDSIAGLKK